MKNFTVILMSSGKFAIHKAGCRDIKRELSNHRVQNMWDSFANSASEVMVRELQELDEQDQGYGEDDFVIAPCTN